MKHTIVAFIFGLTFIVGGLYWIWTYKEPQGKWQKAGNVTYKIVRIEGYNFVATPTYCGYWVLAGPLPEKQETEE